MQVEMRHFLAAGFAVGLPQVEAIRSQRVAQRQCDPLRHAHHLRGAVRIQVIEGFGVLARNHQHMPGHCLAQVYKATICASSHTRLAGRRPDRMAQKTQVSISARPYTRQSPHARA